jgi:MFS family permease
VARFAYTPLLPLMQQQAGLGIADAGWLAAINYGGYLCGAVIASLISDLVLKDRLYRIGMVRRRLPARCMMGLTTDLTVWAHVALRRRPEQRRRHAARHRADPQLADPPQPPQRTGHPLRRHRPRHRRLRWLSKS